MRDRSEAGRPIVCAVGLLAEARIAEGRGVVAAAGGGDALRLAALIEAAVARGVRAVISFGIAGGLAPGLAPGSLIVAGGVYDGAVRWPADAIWVERLAEVLPKATLADLAGVDRAAAGAADKAALRRATGAAAVDMESHVAARLAARHGLPFAALRAVADPAERTLPPAALVGLRPDGKADLGAVMRSLARDPRQLPGLVHAGLDARAALAALRSARPALVPLFGPAKVTAG